MGQRVKKFLYHPPLAWLLVIHALWAGLAAAFILGVFGGWETLGWAIAVGIVYDLGRWVYDERSERKTNRGA